MDSDPKPDWEERLSLAIQTLSEAHKLGFSIGSSPVEPLVEVMVDLALQLKHLLQEGLVPWELRSNKSLKFSETKVDALSNPLVIRTESQRHLAFSPQLSNFFGELAKSLVVIKDTHHLPQDLYSYGEGRDQNNQPRQHLVGKNPSAVHHFRRRRARQSKK